ncbi:adenosylcobinamide-GDP ribazoletransferase [Desulfovibrio sulfodismutans]|uniref:Adenosylcobinamide-GDP ribazoletransferase n=2 Tax=Desulfolutivibrio sulfodismutans TaxID=63561 RepID=A0A7K3NS56_9BACT|nr:adenosylcobinamide-GDP ribazoletransferase [Desulfolutivibrio sulfodismutans]NDY58947.1 adenosylcobinamide-GDP ribazoletransferase [Desulfolutivibrio sulfodismutans]QLA13027.1 adenosylcobinamide-GDP ribazoletransferase [Desulfolutivibrio sulfodismutans DSM 3696]
MFRGFLAALGFLTRFGPAAGAREADFAASVAWFPAVGLVLGGVAVAPAQALYGGSPWVCAWLVVVLDLWATRGLHADGLADVADAWGSMARGERFFEIMKDSRVGAFGAMGLFAVLAGKLVLFAALFESGRGWAVVFSFVVGRACVVWLMGMTRHLGRPGLGRLFLDGARPGVMAAALGTAAVVGVFLVPGRGLVLALVCGAAVAAMLSGLARSRGAVNGDFLGACIVLGEVAACLGMLA